MLTDIHTHDSVYLNFYVRYFSKYGRLLFSRMVLDKMDSEARFWRFCVSRLFVWGLSSHSRIFHVDTSPLPVKFDLCSALMAIDQWGFFSVSHLLWHGAYVYNGHLRGPVKLTPIAERLAVELSLPVFTTKVCRGWDSNTQPSACGANALTNCATAADFKCVLQF